MGTYNPFCGPIIDKTGKWLIYANGISKNRIQINVCGITRSFKNPERNISATKEPQPLPLNQTKSQKIKAISNWKLRAKSDLENEIAELRKKTKK